MQVIGLLCLREYFRFIILGEVTFIRLENETIFLALFFHALHQFTRAFLAGN
jgi:hypothetical protein